MKTYRRSLPVQEDQPKHIKVVVERNFKQIVLDNDNDILLLIFSPTDKSSKKFAEIIENEVVKKLKITDRSNMKLEFAALDIIGNEVEYLDGRISAVPMILLYQGNNKTKYKIYQGEANAEELCDFIVDNSYHPVERDDL